MGSSTKFITVGLWILLILLGQWSFAQGPTTLTVECPKDITLTEGQAYDTTITGAPKILLNNGGNLRLTILEVFQKGNCSNRMDLVTRNFTYTNAIGDQARCRQDIFFRHIKASSIYLPRDTAIEYPDTTSTLTKKLLGLPNELSTVTIGYSDRKLSSTCNTPVKIRRTWQIKDNCTGEVREAVTNMDVYFYQLSFNQSVQRTDGVCVDEGFISLSPVGEFKPYSYAWNNGQKTPTISNLLPGTYTVTITDANQCSQIRFYALQSMSERADIAGLITTNNAYRVVPDSIILADPSLYSKICISPTSGIHYGLNLRRKTAGTFAYNFVKNTDVLNGLSTRDILLIQRHILDITRFRDTLQQIAADVNLNFNITASDMAEIRSIILGQKRTFTKSKPWYFLVPDWRQIAKPNQPISTIEFKGITLQHFPRQNVNVFALKMGDVDLSYTNITSDNPQSRASHNFGLQLEFEIRNNRLHLYAYPTKKLAGLQFALRNEGGFNFSIIQSQLPEGYYHIDGEGRLRVSWSEACGLEWDTERPLFEIQLDGHKPSAEMEFSDLFDAECYDTELEVYPIQIRNKEEPDLKAHGGFYVHPNPSNGCVSFSEKVSAFELFDNQGRKVLEWIKPSNALSGVDKMELPSSLISGVYTYRVVTDTHQIVGGQLTLR